jgi:hypothetical protein
LQLEFLEKKIITFFFSRLKIHLMKHNIVYDEEIHGFKETVTSVVNAGLKKVIRGNESSSGEDAMEFNELLNEYGK